MKIAITSDSHDNYINLQKAINIANERDCQVFLFAGDFIAPAGLLNFSKFNGKVEMIWGNNEGNQFGFADQLNKLSNTRMNGVLFEGELDGVKIFMNHYPKISELAAKSGDYDLSICGHHHKFEKRKIGKTLLLNPGNLKGISEEKAGFVIFNTKDKTLERVEIKN